ncbi:hypothetical protein QBC36DRAFT_143731, partial [Triangularia setosa]
NNSTAFQTIPAPPWAENPGYRGTASIIWSRTVTFVECVHSALHINTPVPDRIGAW